MLSAADDPDRLEPWCRALFFTKFDQELTALDVQQCDAHRPLLIENFRSAIAVLRESPRQQDNVVADMEALVSMLLCGASSELVTTAVASAAHARIKGSRFALLREGLDKTPAGIELSPCLSPTSSREMSTTIWETAGWK